MFLGCGKDGVYAMALDLETGAMGRPTQVAEADGVGFLALHGELPVLYALHGRGGQSAVAAFGIDEAGGLSELGFVGTGDGGGSHIGLSPKGDLLAVAHYGGGSVSVIAVGADGRLGPVVFKGRHEGSSVNKERQRAPHPHWAGFSPDGRFLHVTDLGTDEIWTYEVGAGFALRGRAKMTAGYGPRHLAFHPNGRLAFVSQELASVVSAFSYDAETGGFTWLGDVESVAAGVEGPAHNLSEVASHPNGRFVYAGNRGRDLVVALLVDGESGAMEVVDREGVRGAWPRHFAIDPSGRWLLAAGERSGTVASFRIDGETGALAFSGFVVEAPRPQWVGFWGVKGE